MREELAVVDAKLDGEIKLLAGGTDQLDNDKQSFWPKKKEKKNVAVMN